MTDLQRADVALTARGLAASREKAQRLGLRPLYAPGLPGQFAPEAAAALYWETVCAIGREKEESDGD